MDDDDTEEIPPELQSIFQYMDRKYNLQAVSDGTCFEPVDEAENQRLGLMDDHLDDLFNQHLIFSQKVEPKFRPKRVLDCGTGNAAWATRVARALPCEVLGIDAVPNILPDDHLIDNLQVQVADLNDSFTFADNYFHFVHSRNVSGGINADRWHSYVEDIFRVLRPGGWCQMIEISYAAQSDNGSFDPPEAFALCQWSDLYHMAMRRLGKNPVAGAHLRSWLDAAGFQEVQSQKIMLPMCAWPSQDSWHRRRGRNHQEYDMMGRMLESVGLYPLTCDQQMQIEDFNVLKTKAVQEAADPALQPYLNVWVHIGKKPRRGR